MTSLQDTPGVTGYPAADVERYLRAGLWGTTRIEQLIAEQAARRPDAPAVVDADGTTTYQQLVTRGEHAAGVLAGDGVTSGDTVVLQMPNTVDAVAVLLGAFRLGARPVVSLSTHRGTEIAGFVEAGRATHWILGDLFGVCGDALVADVTARLAERRVEVIRWTKESTHGVQVVPPARPDAGADELAFFQLSGGTTGASKLIPRAHREYAYSFLCSNERCDVDAGTVLVIPLPLTHNFPMSSPGFLGVLSAGGTVVLCAHGDPGTICAAIEQNRATHLLAVPPLAQVLLDSDARREADLSSLRRVIVGGARLSPSVARRIHTELGLLQQVYGMAEGLVCYTSPTDDLETIVTTQGRPISPLDEVRVVAVEEPNAQPRATASTSVREVDLHEVGELQVRGPYTIRGYYFAGPREQASFTTDGFYRTGDLVRRDETGSIAVVGRTKEQINRGGEKIAPAEVEDALLRHPRVHDACVVGEPDELLGERLVAYVVPRSHRSARVEPESRDDRSADERATALDRRELRRHLLAQSLAPFKIPDAYRIVPVLPTTAVGKVARSRVTSADPGDHEDHRDHGDHGDREQREGHEMLDVLGVGFGPANMALAVAIREANETRATPLRARFVDAAATHVLAREGRSSRTPRCRSPSPRTCDDAQSALGLHFRPVPRRARAPGRLRQPWLDDPAADRIRRVPALGGRQAPRRCHVRRPGRGRRARLVDGVIEGYDVTIIDAAGHDAAAQPPRGARSRAASAAARAPARRHSGLARERAPASRRRTRPRNHPRRRRPRCRAECRRSGPPPARPPAAGADPRRPRQVRLHALGLLAVRQPHFRRGQGRCALRRA